MAALHTIDTMHLGRRDALVLGLAGNGDLALLDCGPDRVFANVIRRMRELGFDPGRVTHLLVTHIHLDHSGGAWRWAEEFGVTVWVHPNGYAHLADPSKLISSASRIFQGEMDRLWGEVRPIAADHLRVFRDGEKVSVGGVDFESVETLGHASHHQSYWLAATRTLYAGDAAGVSLEDGGNCIPPSVPPDVDLEAWEKSFRRIRALDPARIVATHGGTLKHPMAALDEVGRRLREWSEWVLEMLVNGWPEERLAGEFARKVSGELRAAGVSEDRIPALKYGNTIEHFALGLARYWRKHHPERLPPARA